MNKKILVVDDEGFMREALQKVLRLDKYEIFETENGSNAIELLSHQDVDLVITDILMPNCDGFSLFQWLRREKPMVKIIFITAYIAPNSDEKVSSLNPDGYVYKPFTIDEILQVCKNNLKN